MTETEREFERELEIVCERVSSVLDDISEQLALLGEQMQKGFESGLKDLMKIARQSNNAVYEVGFKKPVKRRKLPPKAIIHQYNCEPKSVKRTARSDC